MCWTDVCVTGHSVHLRRSAPEAEERACAPEKRHRGGQRQKQGQRVEEQGHAPEERHGGGQKQRRGQQEAEGLRRPKGAPHVAAAAGAAGAAGQAAHRRRASESAPAGRTAPPHLHLHLHRPPEAQPARAALHLHPHLHLHTQIRPGQTPGGHQTARPHAPPTWSDPPPSQTRGLGMGQRSQQPPRSTRERTPAERPPPRSRTSGSGLGPVWWPGHQL